MDEGHALLSSDNIDFELADKTSTNVVDQAKHTNGTSKYLVVNDKNKFKWIGPFEGLKNLMNELTGKETKWSSPGGYCKLLELNEVVVRWYSDSNSLTINGKLCDEFKTQLIDLNKQLQLESEDTNAACVSGNGEISINFDEEVASNESENQISSGQLNEYESLLNTVRSLEAKLESRINDLASEVHETRLELQVEKIARGNLEAEYTELASEALEIRSELDIRNLARDENEIIKSRDESISTVFNKGFLVKENASLKDENALLKQQINNYKCITSDLRTKVKDLENEKDSLVTVIKILQSEQEQHKTEALSSWNVVNRHKKSTKSRNALEQNPSGKHQRHDLQLQNQFIDLSDCESDGNESNTDISAKHGEKPRQSGDKPNQRRSGQNSRKIERRQQSKGNIQDRQSNLDERKDKSEPKATKQRAT
ncbi:Hypothetical predicted protein [Paramuricea clavata]|uniref:Uncharacterized protein n=1 Tax=Paramuricea clavata TaxID=317549 RepID=A0A6S7KD37_PARCT|nr:Hypothetical predicted protein [Paramuricea clavata]